MSVGDPGRELVELLELDLDRCLLTYGIAPCTATGGPGEECYNTFRTCQDPENYDKGTHTYRFTRRGTRAPLGTVVRPYLLRLEQAVTEIDPEKGLAPRSALRVTLADSTDSDTEQDPYIANRAAPAGSTWWRRLIARNIAMAGRAARVKRLYIAPGSSYSLSDPNWTTEHYIIDAPPALDGDGEVAITLKDPLKLADRTKLPLPTDGELSSAIGAADLSLTLKSGKGEQYGTSGYICVGGKEVIQFTARSGDVLSWPSTANRGLWGTAAQAHNANARVQLCEYQSGTLAQILKRLLNAAGIADSQIDLAGIAATDDLWYGSLYPFELRLTEPEEIGKLLQEFCATSQGNVWWDPPAQQVKFVALRPLSPLAAAPAVLTDAANFIDGSLEVVRHESQRVTDVTVFYAPLDATQRKDERSNYQRAVRVTDADARSANEYDDVREKTFYARFLGLTGGQAAAEQAVRWLLFRRDAPIEIRATLDPKDAAEAMLGSQLDVETDALVDFDGETERQRVIVTKRKDNGEDLEVSFLVTFLNRRYFWIAPDGHPDYDVATEEQRRYGYISDAEGKLSDGSDGHVIV